MAAADSAMTTTDSLKAVLVAPNVYWVGVMDWNIRDVHGFWCRRGTTYNAYLVMAEKITLIDTVKKDFYPEMMTRIRSVVDPKKIDIVVSLHAEPDHSGSLPMILKEVRPDVPCYASTVGKDTLSMHYRTPEIEAIIPVADGSDLDLGNMKLEFIHTSMLHWPDSMMAMLKESGVLFSQDGFGLHIATSQRFDDELPLHELEYFAQAYFANILLPFAAIMLKAAAKLKEMVAKDVKIICPSHGPMWRANRNWIIEKTMEWCRQKPTLKATIVYDTMWGSTDNMARCIADGLAETGCEARLMRMREYYRSDVMTEVLTSGALIVGSATLNRGLLPSMSDILTYLKGLRPTNLVGAAFGSYGWGGGATGQIAKMLTEMKVKQVKDFMQVNYVPSPDDLVACRQLGIDIGNFLKETQGPHVTSKL